MFDFEGSLVKALEWPLTVQDKIIKRAQNGLTPKIISHRFMDIEPVDVRYFLAHKKLQAYAEDHKIDVSLLAPLELLETVLKHQLDQGVAIEDILKESYLSKKELAPFFETPKTAEIITNTDNQTEPLNKLQKLVRQPQYSLEQNTNTKSFIAEVGLFDAAKGITTQVNPKFWPQKLGAQCLGYITEGLLLGLSKADSELKEYFSKNGLVVFLDIPDQRPMKQNNGFHKDAPFEAKLYMDPAKQFAPNNLSWVLGSDNQFVQENNNPYATMRRLDEYVVRRIAPVVKEPFLYLACGENTLKHISDIGQGSAWLFEELGLEILKAYKADNALLSAYPYKIENVAGALSDLPDPESAPDTSHKPIDLPASNPQFPKSMGIGSHHRVGAFLENIEIAGGVNAEIAASIAGKNDLDMDSMAGFVMSLDEITADPKHKKAMRCAQKDMGI